ncbi:MAG: radical SAM protein, partial [Gluconacetobacter diazotrophicus]|nr:radical SAM protein [Gluconacetobacter diazotrophicus]
MAAFPDPAAAPFRPRHAAALAVAKFRDPLRTARGEERARVELRALRTLWFNTGTLCNLACANCYIGSTPTNDALLYLSAAEVRTFLDEIARDRLPVEEIGFTGGEPFMNPEIAAMLGDALERGHRVLVLSNAMRPMRRHERALREMAAHHGDRLRVRVSLDHHDAAAHEAERGAGSWELVLDGLRWLHGNGVSLAIAGRQLPGEPLDAAREGYAALLRRLGVPLDVGDPERLVLFPEMDATVDVPEISASCWDLLGKRPDSVMCASSRMVVRRRGEAAARVAACTLLPFEREFDMGGTLREAARTVRLNHP